MKTLSALTALAILAGTATYAQQGNVTQTIDNELVQLGVSDFDASTLTEAQTSEVMAILDGDLTNDEKVDAIREIAAGNMDGTTPVMPGHELNEVENALTTLGTEIPEGHVLTQTEASEIMSIVDGSRSNDEKITAIQEVFAPADSAVMEVDAETMASLEKFGVEVPDGMMITQSQVAQIESISSSDLSNDDKATAMRVALNLE